MKKIVTTYLFVLSLGTFGQEAGKAGELLKNEASKIEMQTKRSDMSGKIGSLNDSSGNRNQNQGQHHSGSNNNAGNRTMPNYDWNQNYALGYAEVFIRIPERGFYTVEVGDQMFSNSSGKYRFFDLIPGSLPVSIYGNGYLIYRTRINVRNNSRLVLDFFNRQGLYLLATYPLQSQAYGNYGDVWNDVWNSPYNGASGQWDPNYGNGDYGGYNGHNPGSYGNNQESMDGRVMNQQTFNAFLQVLKTAKFADEKVSLIKHQLKNALVSSEQVKTLVEALSYDNDRLEIAKFAYKKCVDPINHFRIYPSFQFQNSAQELRDYISKLYIIGETKCIKKSRYARQFQIGKSHQI